MPVSARHIRQDEKEALITKAGDSLQLDAYRACAFVLSIRREQVRPWRHVNVDSLESQQHRTKISLASASGTDKVAAFIHDKASIVVYSIRSLSVTLRLGNHG